MLSRCGRLVNTGTGQPRPATLPKTPFAFSNREAAQEKADGEVALTAQFLEGKGFTVPDEWLVARYVTGATRRSELILFYMEPLSGSGVRLVDLKDGDPGKQLAEMITRCSRAVLRSHTVS
jgi:hypothetical protein